MCLLSFLRPTDMRSRRTHAPFSLFSFTQRPPLLCLTCVRPSVGTVREWARKEGVVCAAVSCRKRRRTVAESSSTVCGGTVLCVHVCVCVCICAAIEFFHHFLLALHSISLRNTHFVFLSPVYLFCSIVCFVCFECDMAGPVLIYTSAGAAATANIYLTRNQVNKS